MWKWPTSLFARDSSFILSFFSKILNALQCVKNNKNTTPGIKNIYRPQSSIVMNLSDRNITKLALWWCLYFCPHPPLMAGAHRLFDGAFCFCGDSSMMLSSGLYLNMSGIRICTRQNVCLKAGMIRKCAYAAFESPFVSAPTSMDSSYLLMSLFVFNESHWQLSPVAHTRKLDTAHDTNVTWLLCVFVFSFPRSNHSHTHPLYARVTRMWHAQHASQHVLCLLYVGHVWAAGVMVARWIPNPEVRSSILLLLTFVLLYHLNLQHISKFVWKLFIVRVQSKTNISP